jgi:hypothetical protein
MYTEIKSISKIDSILGDAKERYFSNGFRNIDFEYTNINIARNSISCKLLFKTKDTWSKKLNHSLKPHLGTVEYFVISVLMSEILLKTVEGLSDEDISGAWVIDFCIKTRPNNNLEAELINVNACVINSSAINNRDWQYKKIISIEIDTISVTLIINHNSSQNISKINKSFYYDYASFIKNYNQNIYTYGYKCSYHTIKNIELNCIDQEATSNIELRHKYLNVKYNGLGSKYLNANLISDHILVTGQLIQVLLYELDNITREESNNLWLRELHVSYPTPLIKQKTDNHIKNIDSRIISMKNESWRMATIEATQENIKSIFKVSHKLPH